MSRPPDLNGYDEFMRKQGLGLDHRGPWKMLEDAARELLAVLDGAPRPLSRSMIDTHDLREALAALDNARKVAP